MAETEQTTVRIRELRLRVPRHALDATGAAALTEAVRRQLPAHLDPAVAGPLAAEVVRLAFRGGSGRARERS
jgi:hypothetical protein